MTLRPSTVFVVDNESLVRFHVSTILIQAGYAVETFKDAEAALSRVRTGDRGCIALELHLPGMDGLKLQRVLHSLGVTLPVIFISGRADISAVVKAMKQGAIDFLTKPIEPSELLDVVACAMCKDEEAAMARAASERARARWATLSAREQQVCHLVATGLLNKQVATTLGTREATVQAQRSIAFKKLGVSSVVELVRILDQLDGLAEPPGGCS